MKRIGLLFLVFLISISLIACTNGVSDVEKLQAAKDALLISELQVYEDFTLPISGLNKSTITWNSNNEAIKVDGEQALVTRSNSDIVVTLTAELKAGKERLSKSFIFIVKAMKAEQLTVEVTLNVTVPDNFPDTENVVIAGSFGPNTPEWELESIWGVATKITPTQYSFIFEAVLTEQVLVIEYKWTRGSWDTVEKDEFNEEKNNRSVIVSRQSSTMTINDTVDTWADYPAVIEQTDVEKILVSKEELKFERLEVTKDFLLPLSNENGAIITWQSSNSAISIEGQNANLTKGNDDTAVILTATLTLNEAVVTKVFEFILKLEDPLDYVVTIIFNVIVPNNTPLDSDVYLAGTLGPDTPKWEPENI